MPVHIGQMTTDLVAEPSDTASASAIESPAVWSEQERFRKMRELEDALRRRTAARGFDD